MGKRKMELPNIGFTWKKIKGILGENLSKSSRSKFFLSSAIPNAIRNGLYITNTMNVTKIAVS